MATLTLYSTTVPLDTDLRGNGAKHIRETKARIKERVELDHNFAGILDTTDPTADGYHAKVTLKYLSVTAATAFASLDTYFPGVSGGAGGCLACCSDGHVYWFNTTGYVLLI